MISNGQYETWFLLYADGELTPGQMQQVDALLITNPELQEAFDAIMSARLQPDEEVKLIDKSFLRMEPIETLEQAYRLEPDMGITFPDKASLYRHSGAIRPITWLRPLMAAASVLLTAGLALYFFQGKETELIHLAKPSAAVTSVPEVDMQEPPMAVSLPSKTAKTKVNFANRIISNTAVQTALVQSQPVVPESISEINEQADLSATTMPVTFDPAPRSNFTQDALDAAANRMASPTAFKLEEPNNANTAVILQAVLKEDRNKPLRGIIRKIGRKLIHDEEADQDGKFIQVANFHLHVSK